MYEHEAVDDSVELVVVVVNFSCIGSTYMYDPVLKRAFHALVFDVSEIPFTFFCPECCFFFFVYMTVEVSIK